MAPPNLLQNEEGTNDASIRVGCHAQEKHEQRSMPGPATAHGMILHLENPSPETHNAG